GRPGEIRLDQPRLHIGEINRLQGLWDMEVPGLPIPVHAVPIEHPVGRVRVLLKLEDDAPSPDGMNPPARHKHSIPSPDREPMKTFRNRARSQPFFKSMPGDSSFQPCVKLRAGFGMSQIPHLGLGLALELWSSRLRRVDLQ